MSTVDACTVIWLLLQAASIWMLFQAIYSAQCVFRPELPKITLHVTLGPEVRHVWFAGIEVVNDKM